MEPETIISLEAPDAVISGLLGVLEARRLTLSGSEVLPLPARAGGWYLLSAERGSVLVSAGSGSWSLSAAQALAVPGGGAASLLPRDACVLTLLLLSGEAASRILQETAARGGLFFPLGGGAVHAAFRALSAGADARAASAAAYELLTRLYGTGCTQDRLPTRIPQVVANAMGLMQREFAFLDGVGDLAGRLEVSQEYLTRTFRACTGMTPGKYLNRLRVEHAKLLLRQPGHTVAFVSDACGFSNGNYFARVFRQFTGMNPREYVQAMSGAALPPDAMPGAFYVL